MFPEREISPDFNGLQPLLQRLDWLIQQRDHGSCRVHYIISGSVIA